MTSIVFLTHSGADSGAEQSVVTYLAEWPDEGRRPLLLLGQSGAVEARARAAGVEVMTVELDPTVGSTSRNERRMTRLAGTVTGLLRHSTKVHRVLRERSADVVVAISLKSLVFGWLAGRRAGATVVWSLHDRIHRGYFSWFLVPALRYLAPRLVDGIMVNSRSTLATIRPGKTPVIVATPPIELDPRDFHEPADDVRRVVMLGRLSPWKGQDLFLRAFARAFDGSAAEAYLVGGALFGEVDYEQELRKLAAEVHIADRVHFVGHVPDPWAWLVDADLLVHASRIPEPFGQVVVEGLWARCAVVASTPGGPAEVITHGVDGILVPCGDEDALVGALERLGADRDLRRGLARQGHVTGGRYDAAIAAPVLDAWLTNLHMGALEERSVRGVFPWR
jgi:glycosyltransferase involved in cell wall biosynthesis